MPLHDWTRADDGLFHFFHNAWLIRLADALNGGLLPPGFFAMTDQRTGVYIPDVVTLTTASRSVASGAPGTTLAEPRADRKAVSHGIRRARVRNRVVVRTTRRVVAAIEVVSPANKDGPQSRGEFVGKVSEMVQSGVHAAVVDILPRGKHDPDGIHPLVWSELDDGEPPAPPPPDRPVTFVGYRAGIPVEAFVNYTAVGQPLPEIPLFLEGDAYVNLPLEATYTTGFDRLPAELKAVFG